ncbi:MAG: peptide ABC transporter ATP-binding protein [Desulfobacterium sp.]|nr:peptide ABC transporter ATP-binding protein [Desulfobacterium sp.]
MTPLLEVRNLQTHFFTDQGIIRAVNGISYDLHEGETLGIVGESGCGKSISAFSILRLIPNPPGKIVNGEVIFEGTDLLQLSDREMCAVRGNKIAMIFQEPMTSLNPVLTIGHQVMEPMVLHQKIGKKQAIQESIQLLSKVQLSEPEARMNSFPHQLSGGMRQRVMIAMGMSCKPKLIIADEPTTALDVTIQAQLLELMKGLTRDIGTALILITHNLGIVARYADRVLVMYAGRIVEKATAKKLYSSPSHPYTIGLLASVPRLDQDLKKSLSPIEGQPPDLLNLPKGCAFHPRCRYRIPKCFTQSPELEQISDNHEKACWVDVH